MPAKTKTLHRSRHGSVTYIDHGRSDMEREIRALSGTVVKVGFQGRSASGRVARRVSAKVAAAKGWSPDEKKGQSPARKGERSSPRRGRKGVRRQKQGKRAVRSIVTTRGSKLRVVDLATIHEFGLGRVPARPYLRPATQGNVGVARKHTRQAWALAQRGKSTTKAVLRLGVRFEGLVKRAIIDVRSPPLAESTKRRRRLLTGDQNPNPLVDTGQLKNSVTHAAFGPNGRIGGNER